MSMSGLTRWVALVTLVGCNAELNGLDGVDGSLVGDAGAGVDARAWPPAPDAGPPTPGPVDDVIAQMAPGSWKSLPGTLMKDVCPLPYNGYHCEAIVSAWSGGAFDTRRDRMILFGGGHGDSFYGLLFVFDLGQMKWQRLTELPAGADGKTATDAMNYIPIEPCGYYPKEPITVAPEHMKGNYIDYQYCALPQYADKLDFQQPRSYHTYNKNLYDPVRDRFCFLAGNSYPSAQTSSPVVHCYDFQLGKWGRVADHPFVTRGASAVDDAGHFWSIANTAGELFEYDPTADAWTKRSKPNPSVSSYGTADRDSKRNQLLWISAVGPKIHRWDLAQPDALPTVLTTTGEAPTTDMAESGFVYADALDRFVHWGGGKSVYMFDPQELVWKRYDGAGDDPGPQQQWGTYGRWRYSPARRVFVLVNAATQDVFLYKPPATP